MSPLLLGLTLLGCRFGGPMGAAGPSDVDSGAVDVAVAGDADQDSGPSGEPVDALNATDAPLADGPRGEGGAAEAVAGADAEAAPNACAAPFASAVCDPVCNTGCPALSRCDVTETPQTGACVGIWITQEGDLCFKGPTTDACAVHLTCLDGHCARLCYRDADCTTFGTCCGRDIGAAGAPTGFKVCGPCAP
jgi:hypothetical protein